MVREGVLVHSVVMLTVGKNGCWVCTVHGAHGRFGYEQVGVATLDVEVEQVGSV